MRPRCLVASVWAMTWLAACAGGADDTVAPASTVPASSTVPVSTVPPPTSAIITTTPPRPGVDERRGTADGDTWVLTTRTTDVDGELCLRLVWEGDDQGWSSCYVVDQGMGDLPWVDPYLQHHDDTPVHFLVGLAPLGAHRVEAWRGATTMGAADVFPGDTLQLGRLGFAVPLPVPDAAAVTRAVDVPGLDVPAAVGVLPPLEAVAFGADGEEVARGGRLVGAIVDVPTLVIGDDPATAIMAVFGTGLTPGGGVLPWSAAPARYGYVMVVAGATYEVSVGGRTERRDLVAVPGTSPAMFLAMAMVEPDTAMSTTFTVFDGAGNVLETVVLGHYLGG